MSGWNDWASGDASFVSGENHAVAEQVVDSMVHDLILPEQWFAKFKSTAHLDDGWYRLICAVCEETYRDFVRGEPMQDPTWKTKSHSWSNWNTARAYFMEDQVGAFSFANFCEINDLDINTARAAVLKAVESGPKKLTRRNHAAGRTKQLHSNHQGT